MASFASAVKNTVGEMTADQKQADLLRVTVDPQKDYPSGGMTTMHGMPFDNTETWYDPPPLLFSWAEHCIRCQAEGYGP